MRSKKILSILVMFLLVATVSALAMHDMNTYTIKEYNKDMERANASAPVQEEEVESEDTPTVDAQNTDMSDIPGLVQSAHSNQVYIYLEAGDSVSIDYAHYQAVFPDTTNPGEGACGAAGFSYGHDLHLFDTTGVEVASASTTRACTPDTDLGTVSDVITYTAPTTGVYTFAYENPAYSSGNLQTGIFYQITTMHNGVETYGNVWLKSYQMTQKTVANAVTFDVYSVMDDGTEYIVTLEEYMGEFSNVTVNEVGNADLTTDACFATYGSGVHATYGGILADIHDPKNVQCGSGVTPPTNLFLDEPAAYLPETSPNSYSGSAIGDFIYPVYEQVGAAELTSTKYNKDGTYTITGTAENFSGFVTLNMDYNNDGVIDQVVQATSVDGVFTITFENTTGLPYIEGVTKVIVEPIKADSIHVQLRDVENVGNVSLENVRTGSTQAYYDESAIDPIMSSTCIFEGEDTGLQSGDSTTWAYGWTQESGNPQQCSFNDPITGMPLNIMSYGDNITAEIWAYE